MLSRQQRRRFEHAFFEAYAALEKWFAYPERLDERERGTLAKVDALLSQSEAAPPDWLGHVITGSERPAVLRLYLHLRFEHLAKRVGLPPPRALLAVYGTLRSDVQPQIRDPHLKKQAKRARRRLGKLVGNCRIRGRLMDLGDYPGLVLADRGSVMGELYELPFGGVESEELRDFRSAIAALDAFEAFNPDDHAASEYVRRYVQLEHPANEAAWVYVLNHPPPNAAPLATGDWADAYRKKGDGFIFGK